MSASARWRWPAGVEPALTRVTSSGAHRYTTVATETRTGTTGFEPAASRLTSECSALSELRPLGSGAGGIRTHGLELMRLARTTAPLPRVGNAQIWPAGVEPAISGSQTGGVATLPHDQKSIV